MALFLPVTKQICHYVCCKCPPDIHSLCYVFRMSALCVTVRRHKVKKATRYLVALWQRNQSCTSWYLRMAAMKHGLMPLISSSPLCWIATREYHRVHVGLMLATKPTTELDFWAPSWYVSTPHTIRPVCTSAQQKVLLRLTLLPIRIHTKHQLANKSMAKATSGSLQIQLNKFPVDFQNTL